MSEQFIEDYKKARRAKKKCTAFKWMAIISGAAAIVLGIVAAIAPPSWEVHPSIIKLIGEFMGIQAMFETMAAVETGADAKLVHNNTTLAIDGNGDGKVDIN